MQAIDDRTEMFIALQTLRKTEDLRRLLGLFRA